MEALGALLYIAAIAGVVWFIIKRRGSPVRPASQVGQRDLLVESFETENPWLERVFRSPAYGLVPKQASDLLARVSPDQDERVFGAVLTRHGKWRSGYLFATNSCLRWIQTFPWRADDFWPYDFIMEEYRSFITPTVLEVNGSLFQVRGRRNARNFRELYVQLQQCQMWENDQEAELASIAQTSAASPAMETGALGPAAR